MRSDSVPGDAAGWPWLKDLAVVALLVVLALKLTHDSTLIRDFKIGDETFYLRFGRDVWRGQPAWSDYGPFYILWYAGLCLLRLDMAALPLLTWRILAALLPISFYVLMRSAGGGRLTSLAGAVLVLTSNAIDVFPYPMHLATVVLALGAALSSRFRSLPWALAGAGLTLLAATYVRPDYCVPLVLYLALGGLALTWQLLRDPTRWQLLMPPAAVVVSATVVLCLALGFPSVNGPRSLMAFGQHYAWNVIRARQLDRDPWVTWEELFRADFGNADSVGEAMRNNPAALRWHVACNLNRLPLQLHALTASQLDLSYRAISVKVWLMNLAAVLAVVGLLARLIRRPAALDSDRGFVVGLIVAAFTLVPTAAQVILVYPRLHYLIPMSVFVTALAGSCLPTILPAQIRRFSGSWAAILIAGMLLLATVPNRAHGWDVQQWLGWRRPPAPRRMEMWSFIRLVKGLHITRPVVVLDYTGALDGRALFTDLDYRMVYHHEKTEPFWQFIEKRDVSVIVLSPELLADARFAQDPEFQAFVKSSVHGRFTVYSDPGCTARVAVRNDVLPAPGAP